MVQRQEGVVRVNCMDCLDRTNVTQSVIARHMVAKILKTLGAIDNEVGLLVVGMPFDL
jgi:hypothetical protein